VTQRKHSSPVGKDPYLHEIVVKAITSWKKTRQSDGTNEHHLLELLSSRSDNFPRIYGPLRYDPQGRPLIFMEFCPGGTPKSVLNPPLSEGDEEHYDSNDWLDYGRIPEVDVWSIFHCSNIFQIGLMMWQILTKNKRRPYEGKPDPREWDGMYTMSLRNLVLECLKWEPLEIISSGKL
jgi:hypothetical protein